MLSLRMGKSMSMARRMCPGLKNLLCLKSQHLGIGTQTEGKAVYLLEEWRHFQSPERQAGVALKSEIMNERPRMQRGLLEEAVKIAIQHFGPHHPQVAEKRVDLAALHQALGDHVEAQRLLVQANQVLADNLGDHHPRVIAANKSLAGSCSAVGDHGVARKLYEQVLGAEERYLSGQNLMIATTKNNLGNAYSNLGDLVTGKRLVLEAADIASRTLPHGHPFLMMAKGNVARHQSVISSPLEQRLQFSGHHS